MTYQRNETPEPLASGVESAIDEAGYTLLSDLAGIDCYDTNLRDQPEAYAALDLYREACAKAATPAPGAPGQEAAFPPRILALLREVADRNGTATHGPFEDGNGEPLQDDAGAALAWIAAQEAAAVQAVGAWLDIAGLIVRAVCESDPADPEHPDTVCVNVNDLAAMIVSGLEDGGE